MSRRLFVSLFICVMALSAFAVTKTCDAANKTSDFKYTTTSKGVTITAYKGKSKKVVIPEKINGKNVIEIYDRAFRGNKNIVSVKMPDTVTKIREGAFANCTNLKKVVTSENLKYIDRHAFKNCTKLKNIDISMVEEIEREAFKGAALTGTLDLSGAEKIWNKAFMNCNGIEKVVFSEELEMLGTGAFRLKTDERYQSMFSTTPFVFCENITAFEIAPENVNYKTADGVIYGKSGEWLIAYPPAKTGVYTVPDEVKGMSPYAFSCAKATEVIIGGGVTDIAGKTFQNSYISKITFAERKDGAALWAGRNAFKDCIGLVTVVFAENMTSAKNIRFKNCSKLSDVTLPAETTILADEMFKDCTSLKAIKLPKKVTTLPKYIFSGCTSLSEINLENIRVIDDNAFEKCVALNGTLTLYADIIGYAAFKDCVGITAVVFEKPVSEIGYLDEVRVDSNVFAGCAAIESYTTMSDGAYKSQDGVLYSKDMRNLVAYPAKRTGKAIVPYAVWEVSGYAFSCSQATEIKLSDSVMKLREGAISDSAVEMIEISESLESIDTCLTGSQERVFFNCPNLVEVNVKEDNNNFTSDNGVLYGKCKIENSYVEGGDYMLLVYPAAKKDKKYTVKKCNAVLEYAFADNKYLKKLYFESDKTQILGALFSNAKKVSVYLPKGMKEDKLYASVGSDKNGKYINMYIFDTTCRKCKLFVKKGAAHEKMLREDANGLYDLKFY